MNRVEGVEDRSTDSRLWHECKWVVSYTLRPLCIRDGKETSEHSGWAISKLDDWPTAGQLRSAHRFTFHEDESGCFNRKTVLWLRRLAGGHSSRTPGFAPRSVHVGFVVDKATLGQGFSEFFGFPLSISFHRGSPYSYVIWEMNTRPVGNRSSETFSHPVDMNYFHWNILSQRKQATRFGQLLAHISAISP
jgi:hypothetical protein